MHNMEIALNMSFQNIHTCWVYPQVETTLGTYLKLN